MAVREVVDLAKAIAWPAAVVWLVVRLHEPIAEFLRTVGKRVDKIKFPWFEIELEKLVPPNLILSATVEALQQTVVQDSGSVLMIAGIAQSATADYVLVPLGVAGYEWLTSRLFLLAALLDRNRVVRCIVFTGEQGTFVGVASPRDMRGELGTRFPEYEQALFAAYGSAAALAPGEFRNGELSEIALASIARAFLTAPGISSWTQPTPPASPVGWVRLDRSNKSPPGVSTWEFAIRVTESSLRTMLRDKLTRGSVTAASGTEEATRAIVKQTGTFVALASATGEFRGLVDRAAIVDKVARNVAEQVIA